jgi:hypothetical protein
MERRHSDDIEILLDRARGDAPRPPVAPRVQAPVRPAPGQDPPPGYAVRPNKPAHRRRISAFNAMVLLFVGGVAIILYISNILRVNQLAKEVGELQSRHDRILNANAVLRAEINRKATWERITALAAARAGLAVPREQPRAFTVDEGLLERAGATAGDRR